MVPEDQALHALVMVPMNVLHVILVFTSLAVGVIAMSVIVFMAMEVRELHVVVIGVINALPAITAIIRPIIAAP